jgi:hypothetical protein
MKILDVPQSGSLAGQTSSRNRFGQYRRTRATPVNPQSSFQTQARARLTNNAGTWRLLTSSQREGWIALGLQIVRSDSLGQTYNLTGLQAYELVNNNRLAAGDAIVSDAPYLEQPEPVATIILTLTSIAFTWAYTPTPLGAGERLFAFIGPQRSAGRAYEGDLRLIQVSAAAGASPLNVLALYTARFGAPVTGNRIFVQGVRYHNGFLSTPLGLSQVVA